LAIDRLPFLAPECIDGKADVPSDLFSLGVLLWEAIARRPLFSRVNRDQTMTEMFTLAIPSLREVKPDLPPALEAFVMKLLSRDPGQRPFTAEDAKFALQKSLFGLDIRTGAKEIGALFRSCFPETDAEVTEFPVFRPVSDNEKTAAGSSLLR